MSNSKPCARCLDLIKNYGIRKVYYSDEKRLIMEKTNNMETNHLSSKYRKPWNDMELY